MVKRRVVLYLPEDVIEQIERKIEDIREQFGVSTTVSQVLTSEVIACYKKGVSGGDESTVNG